MACYVHAPTAEKGCADCAREQERLRLKHLLAQCEELVNALDETECAHCGRVGLEKHSRSCPVFRLKCLLAEAKGTGG